ENILSGVQEYEKILGKNAGAIGYSYLYSDIMKPVIDINGDPIQPVIDIIHSSMMKYDHGTMRYGLKVLENYLINLLENKPFKKEEEIVAKHIFTHLERVGKLAASREDDDSVVEVLTTIFMIGKAAMEQEFESAVGEAVNSIKTIGRLAIKREMEDIGAIVTDMIGEIGIGSAKRKLDFATSIAVNSLGIIGKEAAKHAGQGLEETVWMAGTIQNIGKLAIKQELEQSIFHAINSIGEMGKYTARNDLPKTTVRIVNYLKELGLISLEEGFNGENVKNIVEYLWEIGRIAVWSELSILAIRSILKHVNDSLEDIKAKAQEKGLEEATSASEISLKRTKKLMKEKKLEVT
ncbi:MAG TPA: hypothetical protein VK426_10060, partial [Methanobacterium sp.]|nr:hypothetical protein [Methanobacterium sp.]